MINAHVSVKIESVKFNVFEKDYVWNSSKCICENRQYLASIMGDSTITCHEVLKSYNEEIKTIPTIFTESNRKTQNFYIVIAFFFNYYYIIDSC